ncbi:uncharacterized protein LOC130988205 [Salvia miltiorrhiza]|uniref:uncharacterized protein LOC130988205 n=1 Tax=Salvia miltiorrhiza TaxID=226208 RepID=UPI0025AB82C9|nr:uncharacterized protein LOC130988205 [Salvia miltiorrhiza]
MLKRLLISRRFICHYKPTYNSAKKPDNSESFPFSWPLSVVSCRPINFSRVLAMADGGSPKTASSKPQKHTNRLAAEHSPYLLQHAHNPVDWYPWGEEAFAEASVEKSGNSRITIIDY